MRRFFIPSLIGLALVVSSFFVAVQAASCPLEYVPTVPIPSGYGAAYDIFSAGKQTLLNLDCQPSKTTFTAGSGASNQAIYEKGWKYVGTGTNPGWKEINFLDGQRMAIGSSWFKGSASTIIPQSLIEPGKNYIVAYTCTWTGSSWKCGCTDTACATPKWQLQGFTPSTTAPPPGQLLACSPVTQTKQTDEAVSMNASGGTGTYTWSSPGGTPPSGSGSSFSTTYASPGSNTVTVSSGTQSAQCTATITAPSVPPPPSGFWDEGFKQGVVRSDLGDIKTITMGACLYHDAGQCSVDACAVCQANEDTNYSRSNFYSSVSPAPSDSFWVLDHNNENGTGEGGVFSNGAFSNVCNTGPPNQSLAVGDIGSKVAFGLRLEDVATGKRARLALNNKYNSCGSTAIPYLGFGAQKNRGNNGKDVGSFVKGETGLRVNFTASVDKCARRSDGVNSPCLYYLDVITRWNGKPRQFFVYLSHLNHPGTPGGAHVHWNWPNKNSYFYNGSDLAYLNCEEVGVPCLKVGSVKDFSIDIDKLLIRASNMGLYDDKIPEGVEIPIEGIHWSIETTGPSAAMEATISNITSQETTY